MFGKSMIALVLGIFCLSAGGCLHRAADVPRQGGAAASATATAGTPTGLSGTLLLEDRATPLPGVRVVLKKSGQASVVAETYTDLIGNFSLDGVVPNDSYLVEIDSPDYAASATVTVEPGSDNWREIIVRKR